MSALRTLALASLGLLCASAHAYAQGANHIVLELPDCLDASWRDQLVSSARVELLEDGAVLTTLDNDHPRREEAHIAVAIGCTSDATEARIQLDHASKVLRTVQLSDVPHPLRPRTLALALAELWRTSIAHTPDFGIAPQPTAAVKNERAIADAPRTQNGESGTAGKQVPRNAAQQDEAAAQHRPSNAVDNKASVPASEHWQGRDQAAATPQIAPPTAATPNSDTSDYAAAPSHDARSGAPTLAIAPALRLYLAARNALPGAQLAFRWRSWRIGAEGFYGEHADPLGSARFGLVQGFLSWDLARIYFGAYGLALSPRAAIGGILATATAQGPAFASSATAISWDASGEAAFWCELTSRWTLALRVQLGYAHGTVLASDAGELARLHGLFATAGLSLELHLTDS